MTHNTKKYIHISFHIHTVHLDIIKVLFIHQLMHQWVVLKKTGIKIYIKTAPTVYCRTARHMDTDKDPIYAATPPP